jgi:hypothetical protein
VRVSKLSGLRRFVICLYVVLAVVGFDGAGVQAQISPVSTGRDWMPVAAIPKYHADALPPIMVVDENRTVHAFASLPLSDDPDDPAAAELGIHYRQWTLAGGWTLPNDILLTPIKQQARVKDAFLDKVGIIHLVFYGGDEQEANTYYTWAPAVEAGSAQAWAEPTAIGPGAITPEVAAITGDGENDLVALYSGNLGEGSSLYVTYSEDDGANWSEPAILFSTYSLDNKVFDFDWHLGESGRLYAVWNVTDERGQNVAGYYAKLESLSERQWTEPVEIDQPAGLGIAIPAVTEYDGNVMLIYNNGVADLVSPVMWFKISSDGGNRFTDPLRAFPDHIGRNGVISFVEDSSNTLHTFFGQRIPGGYGNSLDLHGMWHSTWDGGAWRPLTPVVSGPISGTFDPYDARAVVVQGNVILLTWRTDPGREVSSTWYSSRVLETPELPVKPLPTAALTRASSVLVPSAQVADSGDSPAVLSLREVLATATPALPAEVNQPAPEFSKQPASAASASPAVPLLGAVIPTLFFVVVALLFGSLRRTKS